MDPRDCAHRLHGRSSWGPADCGEVVDLAVQEPSTLGIATREGHSQRSTCRSGAIALTVALVLLASTTTNPRRRLRWDVPDRTASAPRCPPAIDADADADAFGSGRFVIDDPADVGAPRAGVGVLTPVDDQAGRPWAVWVASEAVALNCAIRQLGRHM